MDRVDCVSLLRDLTWADGISSRQATLDAVGTLALRVSPQSSVLSAAVLEVFDSSSEGAAAHYLRQLTRLWRGNSRHIGRVGCAAAIVKFLVSID
jgi:hypothetical protein